MRIVNSESGRAGLGGIVVVLIIGLIVGFYLAGRQSPSSPPGGDVTLENALPVPENAQGPVIPQDKGYLVEDLGDGLYWLTDGTYQTMFLTTGEGVIAVDAPPSLGEKYLSAIAEVTDEPVTHVIYSHSHADHIAAAGMFPESATYIAQEEAAAILARAQSGERVAEFGTFVGGGEVPTPDITFSDRFTLSVGNQTLQLEYRGPNHEPGNIFIYAPKQKVLMLVDVIFPGWSPFKELALAEDVAGFIAAHDEVLSYDFDHFVGGHLNRLGTREDVEMQKEYVLDMQANGAAALAEVDFNAIAAEVGFENQWLLFNSYFDALSQNCADKTLEKWGDRLGGADVFTFGHCGKIIESLRID